MHVQLNFADRTSLRRSYTVADQVNEYFYIDAKDTNKPPFELPLTQDEYRAKIKELHLDVVSQFVLYQDSLLQFTK